MTPSPTPQDLPEEIAKAIDELLWAAEIQGQDTIAGDDEVTAHSEAHTNICRMALTAAILSRLREAERTQPAGWVLVPLEPTEAMVLAGGEELPPTHRLTDCFDYFRDAWEQAIRAAPTDRRTR